MYVLGQFSKQGNTFLGLLVRITGEVSIYKDADEARDALKNAMIPGNTRVKVLILSEMDQGNPE